MTEKNTSTTNQKATHVLVMPTKSMVVSILLTLIIHIFSTGTVCAATPGWIADNKTGCKVWNSNPQANESIEWTGGCVDGYADGYGILQWKKNGINNGEIHYTENNGLILTKGKTTTNITNQDYNSALKSL